MFSAPSHSPEIARDANRGLAIIANCLTPYRVNLHRLVASGIPELKLHTLITHGAAEFCWTVDVPATVNLSYFGTPNDSPLASNLRAPWKEFRKGGRLIHYLSDNNIQAVILNGYHYISTLRVIDYCHRSGIPLFGRSDGNVLCERHMSAWKQWMKTRVYHWWIARTTGIMSMGTCGDRFFEKYGADPRRMYRVPYWPDYEAYANKNESQLVDFRQKFRLSRERRYLIYSGRLLPVKRVDLLIDAFVAVASERPEWDLLIVGDGALRAQLRSRIPHALNSRVVWTGFLQQGECATAYHAADVLVLPSDREPWALVVQEALAAGVPVISSNVVGAARELVENHVNGRIFPAGDVAALKRSILDVTHFKSIANYQKQTKASLMKYRGKVDPVAEIRRALFDCNVLKHP